MKIGFVTPYFYPYIGGVQKCVLNLAQNLSDQGCAISIITSDYVPAWSNFDFSYGNFTLKRLRCVGRLAEVPLVPEICSETRKLGVDILHVNGMYPLFSDVATIEAWKNKMPVVLNYHFDPITLSPFLVPFSRVYSRVAPFIVDKADVVVATGRSYVKSSLILSAASKTIQIIPNGVEDNFFEVPSSTQMDLIRRQLGISENEKIVLFVGQLKRFKGIDILMRAFKIVSEQVSGCRLLIVGVGPELGFLGRLAVKLGISNCVVFAGYVNDKNLPFYYHLCDIYVLPSVARIENFGITLLEAMASGKPVLASNLPGPNELVENGVNGFLFEPGNFEMIASLMLNLLTNQQASYVIGAEGRRKAAKYTWKKVAKQFLSVYERIIS